MPRTVWTLLLVFVAMAAAACGGGKSGGATLSQTDVKKVLADLISASVRDDFAAASPHLAVREFTGVNASTAAKPFEKMTPDERSSFARACFNQLKAVTEGTTLRDVSAVDAALAAGTVEVHEKIRRADVLFQGPSSDGKGKVVKLKASLVMYTDGNWHLISVEELLGR